MQLDITTWQRLMCIQALNSQTGNITTIRKALALVDILELNADDRAAVGYSEMPDGCQWADTGHRWKIEIPGDLVGFLRAAINSFAGWPVASGREAVDLILQLDE